MEIKVGEYVRTIYGEIFKVVEITKKNENYILVDAEVDRSTDRDCNDNFLEKVEITKHSPNIIDIIEVDDVIKYKELRDWTMYGTKANETYILNLKSQKEVDKFKKCVEDKDIEFVSIVTKEQFEEMEYKV